MNEAKNKNHKLNVDKIEHQRALARERQRRRRERLSEIEKDVIKEVDRFSHFIKLQKMSENENIIYRKIKKIQQRRQQENVRASGNCKLNEFLVPKLLSEEQDNNAKKNCDVNRDKIEHQRTLARERQRRRRERLKK